MCLVFRAASGSVAERSKALVLGTSLLGGAGSNPAAANVLFLSWIRVFLYLTRESLCKNVLAEFFSHEACQCVQVFEKSPRCLFATPPRIGGHHFLLRTVLLLLFQM